jgi:hypothetical protein
MKKIIVIVLAVCILSLLDNAWWDDSRTRPAQAREGSRIMETDVVAAYVKVEGTGPALVHFSAGRTRKPGNRVDDSKGCASGARHVVHISHPKEVAEMIGQAASTAQN